MLIRFEHAVLAIVNTSCRLRAVNGSETINGQNSHTSESQVPPPNKYGKILNTIVYT